MSIPTCSHCGGPLDSARSTRKYCSYKCRQARYRGSGHTPLSHLVADRLALSRRTVQKAAFVKRAGELGLVETHVLDVLNRGKYKRQGGISLEAAYKIARCALEDKVFGMLERADMNNPEVREFAREFVTATPQKQTALSWLMVTRNQNL
jgi:hypothetical protein